MKIRQYMVTPDIERLPHALAVVGVLFSVVMVAEIVALAMSPEGFAIISVINFVATLPFLAALLGGYYYLTRSSLSPERYPRIATWTVGVFVFIGGFFTIIAVVTPESLLAKIGIVRWGAAAGVGSGATVGIFEARAIHKAVVSERTRIENQKLRRERDRLEEFAEILSHDLRNPLNVAQLYMAKISQDNSEETVDHVTSAHDRMEQIIDNTLVLARSGRWIDETEPVSLAEVADSCWGSVQTGDATLEIEDSTVFVADPDRVLHLFENLFRNAIEHAGSDVTIRVGTLPNGIYVEDDGPGISADDPQTVLERGYSTNDDGTGFGLAIVREIATAHAWDIEATDAYDGGARFEFVGVDTKATEQFDTANTSVAIGL